MLRKIVGALCVVVIAFGFSVITFLPAHGATSSDFDPGNIISDAVFYDSGAMSELQVQAFIDSKVTACRSGYTCLESFRQSTPTLPADSKCSSYIGKTNQLASSIIYDVSQACQVNPQVIIVLLEKEQSLVSDTWPESGQYRSATGYGCPDTAACDADYYGFFNQVYNAAHQFRNYRLNPNSFRYRAGMNNTIQWHPNSACGSSTVFINNQATAGLYNYTPYRPNVAALSNLYGPGDACSAYGNRNFWRTFSDWFGDPTGGSSLVASRADGKVYLVSGLIRHHIPSPEVLNLYQSLMPFKWVDESYFAGFSSGASAGSLIRDPSSGQIFLLTDGGKSYFSTCDLIVQYGYSCSDAIDVSLGSLNRFPDKPAVSLFARAAGQGQIYLLDSGRKRWVTSPEALIRLNGGSWPNVTLMNASFISSKPDASAILVPGKLYKSADSPQIYLIDGVNRKFSVSSFEVTKSLGFGATWSTVDSAVLNGYQTAPLALSNIIICQGTSYIGSGGRLVKLSDPASVGGDPTQLSDSTCTSLPRAGESVSSALMVRDPSQNEVYLVSGGQRHHVLTGNTLSGFFPKSSAQVILVPQSAQAEWPIGSDVRLASGQIYKDDVSPRLFLIDGLDKKIYISSLEIAQNLGLAGFNIASVSDLSSYQEVSGNLKNFIQCGSDYYAGDGGVLTSISAVWSSGLEPTVISSLTCGILTKSGKSASGGLLLQQINTPEIFLVEAGIKRWITNGATLASIVAAPTVIRVPAVAMSAIPTRQVPISLPLGGLARNPNSGQIFLVGSTTSKSYLSSWDVLADLGLKLNWQNFPPSEISNYDTSDLPVQPIVRCGNEVFLGSQGIAYGMSSNLGFDSVATLLSINVCNQLNRGNSLGGTIFIKSTSSMDVYTLSGGQKHFVSSIDRLRALNGGSVPALSEIMLLNPSSLSVVPEGAAA